MVDFLRTWLVRDLDAALQAETYELSGEYWQNEKGDPTARFMKVWDEYTRMVGSEIGWQPKPDAKVTVLRTHENYGAYSGSTDVFHASYEDDEVIVYSNADYSGPGSVLFELAKKCHLAMG